MTNSLTFIGSKIKYLNVDCDLSITKEFLACFPNLTELIIGSNCIIDRKAISNTKLTKITMPVCNNKFTDNFNMLPSNLEVEIIGSKNVPDEYFIDANTVTSIKISGTMNSIGDNVFAIGQVGRISKLKNQIFSCQVFKLLKENENIHLYLIGKIQDEKVLAFIKNNNLNNVHYIGEISNTEKIYSAFDLFIMPSLSESAGISLYESNANGCPSIISNNIPTANLDMNCIKILPLDAITWKNEILSSQDKKRTKTNDSIIGVILCA